MTNGTPRDRPLQARHTRVIAPVRYARMTIAIWAAGATSAALFTLHLVTTFLAMRRCDANRAPLAAPPDAPSVSLIRPLCGIENCIEDTLRSSFAPDYPRYEVIFCVASAKDPVLPLAQRLMAEHPHVASRLLIGDERISDNPKLNNMVKGWRAAEHEWIVFADSNVALPPDYIQRLIAVWTPGTGLVCSPPVGCRPDGFWAELECAFLNTFQARWQLSADSVGLSFAQGKSLLYRRSVLDGLGGMRALASEPAEDAATTKVMRAAGLHVRVVDAPFGQPLGRRSARDVWRRQLRWARLRRASFPEFFALEIVAGGFWPLAAACVLAVAADLPPAIAIGYAALWYGAEALLARRAGWHLSASSPAAWLLRDLMIPVLWLGGWLGNSFVWRGTEVLAAESRRPT
jgi:ceramide glucosyltransferase